jgi:methylated-DNA-protein-cysteine methyltransferase-like protein
LPDTPRSRRRRRTTARLDGPHGVHVEPRPRCHRRPRPTAGADQPPFYRLVYRLVRRVPRGKVVTYGQVAAILGQPRGARAVGVALGALRGPLVESVPWHRVINAAGRCTHRDGFWADIQRERLEEEGVRFDAGGRVDLRTTRWTGPRREWRTRLRAVV